MSQKRTKKKAGQRKKKTTNRSSEIKSSANEKVVWCFDRIDRNGWYAFDTNRNDFDAQLVLDKVIEISNMTWQEVKQATHDDGKSKNHQISAEDFSSNAKKRFKKLCLDEEEDALFSLSISNTIRIFGIKNGAVFYPIWYDPNHEVCPSRR